jgi:hypothetical protein
MALIVTSSWPGRVAAAASLPGTTQNNFVRACGSFCRCRAAARDLGEACLEAEPAAVVAADILARLTADFGKVAQRFPQTLTVDSARPSGSAVREVSGAESDTLRMDAVSDRDPSFQSRALTDQDIVTRRCCRVVGHSAVGLGASPPKARATLVRVAYRSAKNDLPSGATISGLYPQEQQPTGTELDHEPRAKANVPWTGRHC